MSDSTSAGIPFIEIGGEGIDSTDIDQLRKMAKRKLISNKIILSLINVAKKKGKDPKSYWNSKRFDEVKG